jgi:ABC-type multidrug transport system fused ATPase/permease subunit
MDLKKYIGPEKERYLFRSDLIEAGKKQNPPVELSFLQEMGNRVLPSLMHMESWLAVPINELSENIKVELNSSIKSCEVYFQTLEQLTNATEANMFRNAINSSAERLVAIVNNLRNNWSIIPVVYKIKNDYADASKLILIMSSLNARLDGIDKKISDSTKQVNDTANAALGKIDGILQEAARYKEQTKEVFEKSQMYYQNQAMAAFGDAFHKEADDAQYRADRAGLWGILYVGVLGVLIVGFAVLELFDFFSCQDLTGFWRWLSIRIVPIAIVVWLIGHFYKERKSFLHVAVANRHRRNLCNAYIAVSEKLEKPEQEKYLMQILPQLSMLGKTGFITKEDVPDAPGEAAYKLLSDSISRSKDAKP